MKQFKSLSIILLICLGWFDTQAQIDDHHIVVETNRIDSVEFEKCLALWNAPSLEQRIQSGIEQNRKGDAIIKVVDKQGATVDNAEVSVEQVSHDFIFGSKFFYQNAFGEESKNQRYEELFKDIFNSASIPIYWHIVEPEQGVFNYAEVKKYAGYKVPIDAMVKFCKDNNMVMKGHPIVWERSQARWAPEDKEALESLYRKRFEELSGRYRDQIKYWDVVNEPLNRPINKVLPENCTLWSMKTADRYFNPDNKLGINATTRNSWLNFYYEDSPYYLLIKNLVLQGIKIDYIGMQFHLWYGDNFINGLYNGDEMTPEHLFRVLDQYADFNLPIHISEITLPILSTDNAENWQAILGANYFRLLFSHPNVECLTWWNLTDEFARDGKNFRGALTGDDLRLKPLYYSIRKLIKADWHTNVSNIQFSQGAYGFRGFYGKYRVKINIEGKAVVETIHLSKTGRNVFEITI